MKQNYFQKRKEKFEVKVKAEITKTMPKNALIELTNACNHACIFCYNPEMKRSIGSLDLNTFKAFISNGVKEGLEEAGLYATGEPFMTKNIEEFIKIAKDCGLKRIYITSNGALANIEKVKKCLKAGLDSIKFSINAGSRETYKIIHGHDDFDEVIKNLKDIYDYKNRNKIKLQLLCSFVFTNLTQKEIKNFKKKYQKYFDEEIVFRKAHNQTGRRIEMSDILTNKLDEFSVNKSLSSNNIPQSLNSDKSYKPCGMLWERLHLTSEGNLTACCVDYENDLVFKKFSEKEKIIDQFNSEKIVNLRKRHLNNNLKNTICYNCIYNKNTSYEKIDSKFTNNENNKSKANSTKLKSLENRLNQFVKTVKTQ